MNFFLYTISIKDLFLHYSNHSFDPTPNDPIQMMKVIIFSHSWCNCMVIDFWILCSYIAKEKCSCAFGYVFFFICIKSYLWSSFFGTFKECQPSVGICFAKFSRCNNIKTENIPNTSNVPSSYTKWIVVHSNSIYCFICN